MFRSLCARFLASRGAIRAEESERHNTRALNKWETSEKNLTIYSELFRCYHSFQRFVCKIVSMRIFENFVPENEVARMHANRVASREPPGPREVLSLHRYGVCFGASKGCLILRQTSLLKFTVAFLCGSSCHSSSLQEVICLMCCFLSVSIFLLTKRSAKQTLCIIKRNWFFSKINSQIYEQGWFS